MVDVTYRFDDQSVYRGRWLIDGNNAYNYNKDVVDSVLDGIATADVFVFQAGSAVRSEIRLSGYGGADGKRAAAELRRRCDGV